MYATEFMIIHEIRSPRVALDAFSINTLSLLDNRNELSSVTQDYELSLTTPLLYNNPQCPIPTGIRPAQHHPVHPNHFPDPNGLPTPLPGLAQTFFLAARSTPRAAISPLAQNRPLQTLYPAYHSKISSLCLRSHASRTLYSSV